MAAGRHRSFDTEEALEAAMLVFWRNGYPATSLADLTEERGLAILDGIAAGLEAMHAAGVAAAMAVAADETAGSAEETGPVYLVYAGPYSSSPSSASISSRSWPSKTTSPPVIS